MTRKKTENQKLFVQWGGAIQEETGLVIVDTQRNRSHNAQKQKLQKAAREAYRKKRVSNYHVLKGIDPSYVLDHYWGHSKTEKKKFKEFSRHSSILPLDIIDYAIPFLSTADVYRSLMTVSQQVFAIAWNLLNTEQIILNCLKHGYCDTLERCFHEGKGQGILASPLYHNLRDDLKEKSDETMLRLFNLLSEYYSISWLNSTMLENIFLDCAREGHHKMVEHLLSLMTESDYSRVFAKNLTLAVYRFSLDVQCKLLVDGRVQLRKDLQKKMFQHAITQMNNNALDDILRVGSVRPRFNKNAMLKLACRCNNVYAVTCLIKNSSIHPAYNDNEPLYIAYLNDAVDVFRVLLADERVGLTHQGKSILIEAAIHGKSAMVKLLLDHPSYQPELLNKEFVSICSQYNGEYRNLETIKLLSYNDRINPAANNNQALLTAIQSGRLDVVQLLVKNPRVDPALNDHAALSLANRMLEKKPNSLQRKEIVQLLT